MPFDTAAGGARWIYVSNSTDGVNWEPASLALSPDWRDPAGFQVISSISTIKTKNSPIRRKEPLLVGWLPVFHSLSQTIDMQFCASPDGANRSWIFLMKTIFCQRTDSDNYQEIETADRFAQTVKLGGGRSAAPPFSSRS